MLVVCLRALANGGCLLLYSLRWLWGLVAVRGDGIVRTGVCAFDKPGWAVLAAGVGVVALFIVLGPAVGGVVALVLAGRCGGCCGGAILAGANSAPGAISCPPPP